MTISELYAKRAKAWEDAKAFLDSHTQTDGTMSGEDSQTYERMEGEINALTAQIDRHNRLNDLGSAMNQPTSAPITNRPTGFKPDMKTGRASDDYRADFRAMLRGLPQVHNALSEGTASAGGYLVPDEMENEIVSGLADENVIRANAKVIRTTGDHKIPVATTHSAAVWKAEGAAYTGSDPVFSQVELSAYKLTDLVKVSLELIQDSAFDIDAYLTAEFSRAFGIGEEQAFCVGTGSGQPTGIFTANGGTVGVTSASATAITADEIISLVYALKAPYRKSAKFVMKDATVALVRKLKDGNGVYMWQPALAAGQPDTLLGYDLLTSAYAPAVAASAYAVAFGDISSYWIADRMGITVQRLSELYAGNGQIGFIATERVDGKVVLAEGIQLLQMHA